MSNQQTPKTSHTPGPWTHGRTDLASYTHNPNTGETERVMDVYRDHGQDRIQIFGDQPAEDACLIAAAPDLLAALKRAQLALRTAASQVENRLPEIGGSPPGSHGSLWAVTPVRGRGSQAVSAPTLTECVRLIVEYREKGESYAGRYLDQTAERIALDTGCAYADVRPLMYRAFDRAPQPDLMAGVSLHEDPPEPKDPDAFCEWGPC